MDDFPVPRWLVLASLVVLGAIGGVLGYVMREHDKGNGINGLRMFVEGASSGFVGLLVLLACMETGLSLMWAGFTVGIFGWLGAQASIRLLERIAFKKLGISMGDAETSQTKGSRK